MLMASLLACVSVSPGDAGRIDFLTDVGFGDALGFWSYPRTVPWRTEVPLAVGTELGLEASAWTDSSGHHHDYGPNATASVSDTTVCSVERVEPDVWRVTALIEGECLISFAGDADDSVRVVSSSPTTLALADPAVLGLDYLLDAVSESDVIYGALPPPTLDFTSIHASGWIDLWPTPVDVTGQPLFFNHSGLEVPTATCVSRVEDDTARIGGCARSVELEYGELQASVEVDGFEGSIDTIELVVVDLGAAQGWRETELLAWAVLWTTDGRRLLQAPTRGPRALCEWELPDGISSVEVDDESLPEARSDLIGLSAMERPFDAEMRDALTFRCMGKSATAEFTWTRRATAYQQPGDLENGPDSRRAEVSTSAPGCGCADVGGGAGAIGPTLVVAVLTSATRRRRSLRDGSVR